MEFQENPSNETWNTAEKLLCSPFKVTIISYILCRSYLESARCGVSRKSLAWEPGYSWICTQLWKGSAFSCWQIAHREKEPIMRQFPTMTHPSCGQRKCWNLVVTTWTASFRPWTLSVSNRKLCVTEDSSQKGVSYFSVLEIFYRVPLTSVARPEVTTEL